MNAGQRLVALSGLPSGSAASHFLAIVQGTGTGATVIAYRSDVQVSTPVLRITSRPKRRVQPQQEREPAMLRNKATGNTYAFSETTGAGLSVITQRNESLSVVGHQRRFDVFTATDEIDVTTTIESTVI